MSLAPSLSADTPMMPADAFAGGTVYITEAGDGIGLAVAREFARCGANVAIAEANASKAEAGAAQMAGSAGRILASVVDLCDPDSIARSFDEVEAALGPITALVNYRRPVTQKPAERISPSEWRQVTDHVLDGTFFTALALAKRCLAAGRTAAIVNWCSPHALTGGASQAHAEAARAGVLNLTKSLAVEWAPDGIRINAIAPGYVEPDASASQTERERQAFLASTTPAGRLCAPNEIAWCVLFMCSPFAAYLTGHCFDVDGASWQRPGRTPPEFTPIRERYGAN